MKPLYCRQSPMRWMPCWYRPTNRQDMLWICLGPFGAFLFGDRHKVFKAVQVDNRPRLYVVK